jgi:hypothetical protein
VSNKRGRLVIHHAESSNIGASSVVHDFKDSFLPDTQINAAPLGDLLSSEEISKARMIKIDVEGAEWLVIEGMKPLFERLRADIEIMLEVTPDTLKRFDKTFDDLINVFKEHGFSAYTVRNEYKPDDYLLRIPMVRPLRLKYTPANLVDLVFSKEDKESL